MNIFAMVTFLLFIQTTSFADTICRGMDQVNAACVTDFIQLNQEAVDKLTIDNQTLREILVSGFVGANPSEKIAPGQFIPARMLKYENHQSPAMGSPIEPKRIHAITEGILIVKNINGPMKAIVTTENDFYGIKELKEKFNLQYQTQFDLELMAKNAETEMAEKEDVKFMEEIKTIIDELDNCMINLSEGAYNKITRYSMTKTMEFQTSEGLSAKGALMNKIILSIACQSIQIEKSVEGDKISLSKDGLEEIKTVLNKSDLIFKNMQ